MGEAAGVICALSPIDIASASVKPGHMGSPLDDERRRVYTRTIEAGRTEWPAPNAADVVIASAAIAS
jgi:hypothetical protein